VIFLKCILWFWAAQVAFAALLLARYGLGQLVSVVSERVAARKVVEIEMENA
jgi:hypothetical protein